MQNFAHVKICKILHFAPLNLYVKECKILHVCICARSCNLHLAWKGYENIRSWNLHIFYVQEYKILHMCKCARTCTLHLACRGVINTECIGTCKFFMCKNAKSCMSANVQDLEHYTLNELGEELIRSSYLMCNIAFVHMCNILRFAPCM